MKRDVRVAELLRKRAFLGVGRHLAFDDAIVDSGLVPVPMTAINALGAIGRLSFGHPSFVNQRIAKEAPAIDLDAVPEPTGIDD